MFLLKEVVDTFNDLTSVKVLATVDKDDVYTYLPQVHFQLHLINAYRTFNRNDNPKQNIKNQIFGVNLTI